MEVELVVGVLSVMVPLPSWTIKHRLNREAGVVVVEETEEVEEHEVVEVVEIVPEPSWIVRQRLNCEVDVDVVVLELVEHEVVPVVDVCWAVEDSESSSSSSSSSSSPSSESESLGSGPDEGGVGPPAGGFPEGSHPPPRPQLLSSGHDIGTLQPLLLPPLLPPPVFSPPVPQMSLNTLEHPQARVDFEPSDVVTEVPV